MVEWIEDLLRKANLQSPTGRAYERKVKRYLEGKGFQVYQNDYANCMPDWRVHRKDACVYIECKNYRSVKTEQEAIKKMVNSEKSKLKNKERAKLTKHQSIIYLIAYGGKHTVTALT